LAYTQRKEEEEEDKKRIWKIAVNVEKKSCAARMLKLRMILMFNFKDH
jgi:hypothetical protein